MSATRRLQRQRLTACRLQRLRAEAAAAALALGALPALIVAAAVLGAVAAPAPAFADDGDVRVRLSGLNSSLSAGRADQFSVRLQNRTDEEVLNLRRVIIVQLPGLDANQVDLGSRLSQLAKSAPAPGQVQFEDATGFRLGPEHKSGDEVSDSITIRFDSSTPAGRASVTVLAIRNNESLGSAQDTVNVRGTRGQQNPRFTPTPTLTSLAPVTVPPPPSQEAEGSVTVPPLIAQPSGQGTADLGFPPALYVMGGLLVAVGGVILWLLLRRPQPAAVAEYHGAHHFDTSAYPQIPPPSLGYPRQPPASPQTGPQQPGPPNPGPQNPGSPPGPQTGPPRPTPAPLNPTMVMPPVRDPRQQPPADPWSQR